MLSPAYMASLRKAAETYRGQLSDTALHYLDSRGLVGNMGNVLDTFLLGSVEDPLPGHEQYVGRVSIPYITPAGVVNMKFRDITGNAKAKYLGLEGEKSRLFNVQALHDAEDVIYIAEGELDAISATVHGYPCVGVPGVKSWKPHFARCLEDFENIVILADGDNAGREYAKGLRQKMESAQVVWLPDGEDVNSILCDPNAGQAKLAELIGAQ